MTKARQFSPRVCGQHLSPELHLGVLLGDYISGQAPAGSVARGKAEMLTTEYGFVLAQQWTDAQRSGVIKRGEGEWEVGGGGMSDRGVQTQKVNYVSPFVGSVP